MHTTFSELPDNAVFTGLGRTGVFLKLNQDEFRATGTVDRSIIKASKIERRAHVKFSHIRGQRP